MIPQEENMNNLEFWVSGTGQQMWIHSGATCVGERCPVHNPSVRAKSIGVTHYRFDRGIMERICEHGVGHPDPDDIRVRGGDSIHGCDGCCKDTW